MVGSMSFSQVQSPITNANKISTTSIQPKKEQSNQFKNSKHSQVHLKKGKNKLKTKRNNNNNNNGSTNKIPKSNIFGLPTFTEEELSKFRSLEVAKSLNVVPKLSYFIKSPNEIIRQNSIGNVIEVNKPSSTTLKDHRLRAVKAYNERKIFTIYGNFGRLRRSLIQRGWVERIRSNYLKNLNKLSQHSLLMHSRKGNDYEKVSISRLVQAYPSFFIWHPRIYRSSDECLLPYKNRIRRDWSVDFSSKVGLMGCADRAHWNTIDSISEVNCPRFYRLESSKCNLQFLHDYRITACLSLLNFIVTEESDYILYDDNGKIPIYTVQFAIEKIEEAMKYKKESHLDLDNPIEIEEADNVEWRRFISNARLITRKAETLITQYKEFTEILLKITNLMVNARKLWPTIDMDGYYNMWILKPGFQCRGNGIVIYRDYEHIISFAEKRTKSKYIVQKYIERPFLIYFTKFDIRQYLLVTISSGNINMWMYKNCYLRFSSREFSLSDTDRSIHLTNHSVQKRYKNNKKRNPNLPSQNMWSLEQFKNYLKENGNDEDVWEEKIYPCMKRSVLAIVLASLEGTDITPNIFEIYGCDFILDEKLNPLLLEINSNPDMSHSTKVTANICPAALEDVIKVVIDRKKNKDAPTGKFELIHQVNCQKYPSTNYKSLEVKGSAMEIHQYVPKKFQKKGIKVTNY